MRGQRIELIGVFPVRIVGETAMYQYHGFSAAPGCVMQLEAVKGHALGRLAAPYEIRPVLHGVVAASRGGSCLPPQPSTDIRVISKGVDQMTFIPDASRA